MIRIDHLSFGYNEKVGQVLKDISIEIGQGEYIGVIGPNGSGKTTLIRHLNGLLSPQRGDVWIDGLNTKDRSSLQEIRKRVGMVFQNPDTQIVGMSVEEDVAFGPGNLCLDPSLVKERVFRALELVGMREYAKRAPHTLSNGEKQLVAVAGVLAVGPKYIALDEPTSYLDPAAQKRVLEVIGELNKNGVGIIHVTHEMDEVVGADRILVLDQGEIRMASPPHEVFGRGEWLRALGLEIPKVTELMWRLRRMGMDVRTNIWTSEEACSELSSLMKKGTG